MAASPSRRTAPHVLAAWSSMLGTSIEWFDFFLYGTAAALVFNRIFFPRLDPLTGQMAAFATYAVGFVGRPLGGIVFGHVGDRAGRKTTLLLTLLLMGVPTVLIGLLPPYASIGYWAALLLILLRFVQGVAVGGEWGGAVLMAVEHAPEARRGFFGSLPQMGIGPGLVLSSLAMSLVSLLPEPALFAWGWRLPFLASAALVAVGWFIRSRVPESPEFLRAEAADRTARAPALLVMRRHGGTLLALFAARVAENTWFYVATTFAIAYVAGTLRLPRALGLNAITAGALLSTALMPLAGAAADRIGARRLFTLGLVLMVLGAWPLFALLDTRSPALVVLALVLAIGVVHACVYGPEATLFAAQFPPELRYSGISIAVQAGSAAGGGLAPIAATALLAWAHGDARAVALYLAGLAALGTVCTRFMRKPLSRPEQGAGIPGLAVPDRAVPDRAVPDRALPDAGPTYGRAALPFRVTPL